MNIFYWFEFEFSVQFNIEFLGHNVTIVIVLCDPVEPNFPLLLQSFHVLLFPLTST